MAINTTGGPQVERSVINALHPYENSVHGRNNTYRRTDEKYTYLLYLMLMSHLRLALVGMANNSSRVLNSDVSTGFQLTGEWEM